MRPSTVTNVAVAAAVGCCAAALIYSLSRAIQFFLFPSPDPRTVVNVTRIAFFWRMQIAAYGALLAALGAAALRGRAPDAFDRVLPLIITATVVLTAVQGIFIP